jgi:hypothetical protein
VAYATERAIQEDGRLCKVVLVGSKSTLQMLAIRDDSTTSQGYVETHAFDVLIVGDEWIVTNSPERLLCGFVSNSVAQT